ncbi:MAG: diguanylate cyclase, partial [Cyanobacteria bacterium J06598_3]
WIAGCFYLYVLTGTLMVGRAALRPSMLYRQQALTVIISALPPLTVGTLYILECVPPGISLLPMSFLVTGLIYFTSLFRFRLFDLRPIARDTLIERMNDSVLVLDNEGRILDMNPAAHRFTQFLTPTPRRLSVVEAIGQPLTTLLSPCPALAGPCGENICHPQNSETLVTLTQPPLHLNLRFSILHDSQARLTGQLLVIQDVTAQYQAQCELKQNNEILEQRLLKIEALQDQLKEQAIRDGLTKLFNRRYFEEALLAEFSKARRYRTSLAIILIDIDHFKRVNDTYGHQAGDCALQVFAALIREHVRTSDIACRYGGEEFILAMPGMTLTEAHQRAEALRIAFKETAIEYKGQTIQATISGGVGAFPDYEGSPDGLISVVDKALYKAKENGRDRIYSIQLDNTPLTPPILTPTLVQSPQ